MEFQSQWFIYECIVVGLGGHGSAAVAHLSQRLHSSVSDGKENKVLGIEKFQRVHNQGSSHGRSRIIRQAYFEDPKYVPLLKRAFQLWRELSEFESLERNKCNGVDSDSATTENLLNMTGGIMIGLPSSEVVKGTIASVQKHSLTHEILNSSEIKARYPHFSPSEDEIGVLETEAGYLIPEASVEAHLKMAELYKAELRFEESMISWEVIEPSIVKVETSLGVYYAKKIILSVGAWAPEVYGRDISSQLKLSVERRVLYWFEPQDNHIDSDNEIHSKDSVLPYYDTMPVYIWDLGEGRGNFYGFPRQSGPPGGVKVAYHYVDKSVDNTCTPASIDREVHDEEIQKIRRVLADKIPSLNGRLLQSTTCMYTMTPDEHFLIDKHPRYDNVILASPCSGHGFKFCSVVGEILADLILNGDTFHDISMFRLSRG